MVTCVGISWTNAHFCEAQQAKNIAAYIQRSRSTLYREFDHGEPIFLRRPENLKNHDLHNPPSQLLTNTIHLIHNKYHSQQGVACSCGAIAEWRHNSNCVYVQRCAAREIHAAKLLVAPHEIRCPPERSIMIFYDQLIAMTKP
jgi:hypothetical protein